MMNFLEELLGRGGATRVGGQADLDLEDGVIGRLQRLLFGNLRRVDADREGGQRRVPGVESEISVERNAELLADPVHQRDIDRRLARPLAVDALEDLGHDLAELQRIGG